MPTSEEITKHHEPLPDRSPWVNGPPKPAPIVVVEYDESWPRRFDVVAQKIRAALGDAALAIEHVGSTSVRGLPAKPTIDVDVTVADPADELAYVPALSSAGFTLVIREPEWHEHRCLTLAEPSSNVHVFGPDCPEVLRHRMFRQWLTDHPEDLELYRRAKLAAAAEVSTGSGLVVDYNKHKEPVIRAIYERMFRASGLLR
ncbi:GrpB family protein [Sorangium sp. So ce1182]|uniref:GrpB family protein n=1 Tax=Sorangium sp. So ce1182 TaxID=3133334 RepID=UPI003F622F50